MRSGTRCPPVTRGRPAAVVPSRVVGRAELNPPPRAESSPLYRPRACPRVGLCLILWGRRDIYGATGDRAVVGGTCRGGLMVERPRRDPTFSLIVPTRGRPAQLRRL